MFWSAGGRHEISKFATSQSKILPFVAVAAIRTSHAASPPTTRVTSSAHTPATPRLASGGSRRGGQKNVGPKHPFESLPLSFVAHLDTLGTVREAIEFLDHCTIWFEDGEPLKRGFGRGFWTPRDPFVGDIPKQWLSQPIDNTADSLRDAVWRFVTRHQHEKLEKHVRCGDRLVKI